MKEIEHTLKLSVLHCVYQLIASAEGSIDEERDYEAIELSLNELGLKSVYAWDAALKFNPHDCFSHISTLEISCQKQFKDLLLKIVEIDGNPKLRLICANHIFQLCNLN